MFSKDKILHFIAGFIITVVFSYMAYIEGLEYPQAYGITAGALAGACKEAWDEYSYGGGDFFDFFATIVGVFVGGALVVLL